MNETLFEVSPGDYLHGGGTSKADFSLYEPEVLAATGEAPRMVVNAERIDAVLSTLLAAYESNEYPYYLDSVRLPHDPRHMPEHLEHGSNDHAMFLWNVCYYMRGGIKSVDAVKRLASVYDEQPELFNCDVAAEYDEAHLAATLKSHGLGFQGTVSRQWKENARRLRDEWGGDPRAIFDGVTSYEQCLERIKNDGKGNGFVGFQEKMTSMIMYYLMDEGMIQTMPFPIPVDLHVMRVSIANKLIEFPDAPHGTNLYSSEMLATLRKIYFDYAVDHGVNPLRLCDAVWLLSESSCGRYPGNVTLEPLGRAERNGRSTVLLPQAIDITSSSQQAAYENSCRSCPIESTCEFMIPGKHYYVGGSIIIRGKRVKFPESLQQALFDID